MPMRLTLEERDLRQAAHQSARTISDTPELRRFLARPDVTRLQFPSGWFHVFVGDRPFVGLTLLAATEAAKCWADAEAA